MGLDTVELVVAFEEHFQLAIPNQVAETIGTVEQAAAAIAYLKGLPADPARTAVYYQLLARLLACLPSRHPAPTEATLLVQLELLGANKARTQELAACLQLQMPDLPQAGWQPRLPGWWQRLFGTTAVAPTPPPLSPNWARSTVADLTEWLLAQNYQLLLPQPTTLYEVQRAVVGLTSDRCGVPVPEIWLTDSFTNDLGMD
ncbi:hypothetical protein [Hymenobacter sp. APR13]|uniref:hypothetical protein n=1 Tax=Hymenobacter sp. APR13 TaxID=1356852 RepID=UPI0004E0A49D|nr:hypothetical protein [Hymenobacter sp. APR13]AII52694.1 hypothetical protein N008_12005 [Hymenobacter sp. APR13]